MINLRKPLHREEQETKNKIHTGEGLTEQSHKEETDMNYILREYTKHGYIKHSKENQGRYDDITVQDFQEAMFIVKESERMFSELPANIRKRFEQDPKKFLAFVQDKNNIQEMHSLGILKGNDGIDIKGTIVDTPTEKEYVEKHKVKDKPQITPKE